MSTTPITFEQIDREIRALGEADWNEEPPAQLMESVDRLFVLYEAVLYYQGVRSLLLLISTVRILPPNWRAAMALFIQALDAVAASVSGSKEFKAGKDQ